MYAREGLDGYAYLRALAGRIHRVGGPDAARGPPVGQRWHKYTSCKNEGSAGIVIFLA